MPDRRKSRSRSRRKRQKSPSAASDVTGQNEDPEELSLEARVSLLEVDMQALKAENRELRKKLVEALSRKSARDSAPATRHKELAKEPAKDAKKSRRKEKEASPPPARSKEQAAKDRKETKAPAKGKEESASEDGAKPAWASASGDEAGGEDDSKPNAVMLVNAAMEAYNEEIPNNIPLEKRLPMVEEKMGRFTQQFGDNIQILDLKSGGAIIKDRKIFKMRYGCVFRESGTKLKVTTNKRFYFDASGKAPTYCLDFEVHESLVTPQPGTRPDGSLGCRPPRTEHLVTLYEEQVGKIVRMWIAQDPDKVGQDAMAGEEILKKLPVYKQFEKKIAELKGAESAGEYHFNNYHNIPTVG